MYQGWSTA
jgi:hypothetical protein